MTNKIIKTAAAAILGLALLVGGVASAAAGTQSKKKTAFENLSAMPLVVKPGGKVTFRAQLFYFDKKGKYQQLRYKSVPVEFWANNRPLTAVNTDGGGWATVTIPVAGNARPGRYTWRAKFRGDQELLPCWRDGDFAIAR